MTEEIDVFDANHQLLGSMDRRSAHRQGLWHQTFHCWIVTGEFLVLQLRAATKANYPNMLDISAAGHLEAGERPEEGVREIQEELGIDSTIDSLIYLGIKHDVMDEKNGSVRNREFAHVYLLIDGPDLDSYVLAEDEVAGLVKISIKDSLSLFSGEVDSIDGHFRRLGPEGETTGVQAVRRADLIPRVDNYYYKIAVMAARALEGNRYLTV